MKSILHDNNSETVISSTLLWNFAYSLVFGFQSVVVIMVLTRFVGLDMVGYFTIGYANASLFLLGGKYGVRNYQVSDVRNENGFREYLYHRRVTILFVGIVYLIYILYCSFSRNYAQTKTIIMILLLILKIPDSIEDVYAGEYQKQGRLDIAAKLMTLRLAISTLVLVLCVVLTKNLIIALLLSIIISFAFTAIGIRWTNSFLVFTESTNSSVVHIFVDCFPLFLGSFLNQYINNAPKNAIDSSLPDTVQACYGFIAMPVFVISLLSNVIFAPIVHGMANNWEKKEYSVFIRKLFRQIIIVTCITIFAVLGGWFLGIPILSVMYNTDLSDYKFELIILLLSGGFLALSGIMNIVITIQRSQVFLIYGYTIISLAAFCGCRHFVVRHGIIGVALYNLILMILMSLFFGVVFVIKYHKTVLSNDDAKNIKLS